MIRNLFIFSVLLSAAVFSISGQGSTVTYEELYDDPYDTKKLFIHFQPLYGEVWSTNVNIGFGMEAEYLMDKLQIRAAARKAYGKAFDMTRDAAIKNASVNTNVDAPWNILNYYEAGVTYHIKDFESDSETKIVLYSDRYRKNNKWAASTPELIKIPSKVRKIYGARLGGKYYDSSVDLDRAMKNQGTMLNSPSGEPIAADAKVYSNMSSYAIYLGGSMSWYKNIAIDPDRSFGVLINDLMFTTYFDLIYAPGLKVEDVFYNGEVYSADDIELTKFGFRAGLQGKFNRTWGWSYNIETGIRPTVKTQGFYIMGKISFPVFATKLENTREAFGK
ncbi:hypothetical protein [Marinigracilibium pacificum]|uniref:Uncharacterized protein n=1 Tax=Marinigracilibium pacificum TaxID=2729599 RepID=A0A848J419_9BACT|nr:hypothetical protein [Marinigracilibium pacificum]NMM50255.1 hypothetical protein [Marinigracilibium pacificum]